MSGIALWVLAGLLGAGPAGAKCKGEKTWCPRTKRCEYASKCPRRRAPPKSLVCREGAVLVEGGSYWLGSRPGEGEPDEVPRHKVILSPFCMDRIEVTTAAYAVFVREGGQAAPRCFWKPESEPRHPVVCVGAPEAKAYCAWRGGRLPTEAEWEAAARGKTERRFPWGDAPVDCSRMPSGACGAKGRSGVGMHSEGDTPDGISDLGGNVWEWVSDWYVAGYKGRKRRNPRGPVDSPGRKQGLRGGCFRCGTGQSRAAARGASTPFMRSETVGFRCVSAPEEGD